MRLEEFDKEKVYRSRMDTGAAEEIARDIAEEVARRVREGSTTDEIGRMVWLRLSHTAARRFYGRFSKTK